MPSHCRSDRLTQRKGKLPKGRGATMKHGREEEDSLSASSDTTVSSAGSKQQALRFAEDLSLPSVQVVVMSANMGCSHCRQRVANVVSKMNAGLLDYMVDFGKEEVTVRGKVHTKKKKTRSGFAGSWEKKSPSASPCQVRTLSWFLGCYGS